MYTELIYQNLKICIICLHAYCVGLQTTTLKKEGRTVLSKRRYKNTCGNNKFTCIEDLSESIVERYRFPNNGEKLWKYLYPPINKVSLMLLLKLCFHTNSNLIYPIRFEHAVNKKYFQVV
jgi:hypothetical protein